MIEITTLPHVLAGFNSATVASLLTGFYFIRKGDRKRHKAMMITALCLAATFMVIYFYYHANSGLSRFGGEGLIRPVYFTILSAHVMGAAVITPVVPYLAYRAFKGRFEAHGKMARWALPLWLCVSLSGVVVYILTIHIYPFGG